MDEKGNKKYFKNKDLVSLKKGDKMAEEENNKIKIQYPQNLKDGKMDEKAGEHGNNGKKQTWQN